MYALLIVFACTANINLKICLMHTNKNLKTDWNASFQPQSLVWLVSGCIYEILKNNCYQL